MVFKKGYTPWNKNKKCPKISKTLKGKKLTKEHKRKISRNHRNFQTEETKRKLSLAKKGKNNPMFGRKGALHPNWLGGISFEPYGLEFNEDLKEVIRNRDRRKCQICGKTELENCKKLDCHHIDYNKKNNNPNNLIALCFTCHPKTNHNRDVWIKFFKELYEY